MMSKKSPQLRFEGFTDDWEERKLGEVVKRVTRKNKELESTLPLTISAQEGLIDQNEFFNKTVASRDVSGYYLVKNGEFAYNKSYSNGYPWGAVKRLNRYDMGVLSTLYIVFKPIKINSDFLEKYYDTTYWYKEVSKYAAEGARNHGLLNIAAYDFFETKIVIPSKIEEQQKIGALFKQLDKTIALHQRKLDLLKEQKKGYLQKMFPKNGAKVPELRFAGFADDWEQRRLGDIFKKDTQKNKDLEFHSDSVISVAKMKLSPPSAKSSDEYMKTYNKIRKGNVAFEGHTNDEFPNGRFVLNDCQDGIVSHIYDVYSAVDEYNNEFMKRYINNPDVMRKILINATSSARMMKSLNSIEFLKQSILLPILSEQQKIGKFFYQLDNTITLHQRKLDLLKEQKKGFLQKMFV